MLCELVFDSIEPFSEALVSLSASPSSNTYKQAKRTSALL